MPLQLPHSLRTVSRLLSTAAAASTRVSLYLRRADAINIIRLRLRRHDPSVPFPLPSTADPFILPHLLRSAPSPDSALSLFRSIPSHSSHTVHALAAILASARRVAPLRTLLDAADSGSFPGAPPPSPLDRLRWFSAAGDVESALKVWTSIRSSAPSSVHGHPCTESYNLVMGLYINQGLDRDAVDTLQLMIDEGSIPNPRTFTVIIEHLVRAGKLDVALELFDKLPLMRVRRTSRQYDALAGALSSLDRSCEIRKLVEEMKADGLLLSRGMRAAIARMRDAGQVEGIEEFLVELSPNDRIGYVMISEGNDSADEEDEGGENNSGKCGEVTKLKPWLDPNALTAALSEWDEREVEDLGKMKLVWTTRLVCKFLRGFRKVETAWKFFNWVAYQSEDFTHDRHTMSRMITILARNGRDELVDRLVLKVKTEGIILPFSTVRLVVDLYGISKKPDAALKIFQDVDSICGPLLSSYRGLLCSSLLRTLAKCKRGKEALNRLDEMMINGVLLDLQTFSGLIEFFATEGDLSNVHKLFGMVRQCGLEPDAYLYQAVIRGYIKLGRAALALRVFEDMRNSGLCIDVATKSLLVKSLWKEGKRREVAYVDERSEEVGKDLPAALAGHVWTVSSADLTWVYNIYRNSFLSA